MGAGRGQEQSAIAAPAGWFPQALANPLRFVLNQVEHYFHHPRRGKDLLMVDDALLELDIVHKPIYFGR